MHESIPVRLWAKIGVANGFFSKASASAIIQ
jgi:hypothetical protein